MSKIVFVILTLQEFHKLISQEHIKPNFKPLYRFLWVTFAMVYPEAFRCQYTGLSAQTSAQIKGIVSSRVGTPLF